MPIIDAGSVIANKALKSAQSPGLDLSALLFMVSSVRITYPLWKVGITFLSAWDFTLLGICRHVAANISKVLHASAESDGTNYWLGRTRSWAARAGRRGPVALLIRFDIIKRTVRRKTMNRPSDAQPWGPNVTYDRPGSGDPALDSLECVKKQALADKSAIESTLNWIADGIVCGGVANLDLDSSWDGSSINENDFDVLWPQGQTFVRLGVMIASTGLVDGSQSEIEIRNTKHETGPAQLGE